MSKQEDQVLYNGMWIDRHLFRAFVYKGEEKRLADSYDEFLDLIALGYTEHPNGIPHESNLFEHAPDAVELPLYEENNLEPLQEPVRRGRKRKQIDILS